MIQGNMDILAVPEPGCSLMPTAGIALFPAANRARAAPGTRDGNGLVNRSWKRNAVWTFAALLLTAALGCGDRGNGAASRLLAYDQIVLVTLDTLRADHLGAYGYPRKASPFIDGLAERGVVFERAYAAISTTGPSHATIFTGLYPLQHRVQKNGQGLPDAFVTLAEILSTHGFATAAFVSSRASLRSGHLNRGFRTYDEPRKVAGVPYRPADETIDTAIAWLEGRSDDGPLFVWVHLFDAHLPRQAPLAHLLTVASGTKDEKRTMMRFLVEEHHLPLSYFGNDADAMLQAVDEYDAELAFADTELSRFYEAVSRRDVGGRTLWIITSDHGEGLGNHHWMHHGKQIYEEQMWVPLIFHASDGSLPPRRVPGIVEHVDLLPTIASLTGTGDRLDEQFLPIQGRSLVPLLAGEMAAGASPRTAFVQRRVYDSKPEIEAQIRADPEQMRTTRYEPGRKYGLVERRWKYVHRTRGRDELFDLQRDPYETRNLVTEHPERAREMKARLLARAKALREGAALEPHPVDAETAELLEELGYGR
jgi:arylsulfatase A-like enzyme